MVRVELVELGDLEILLDIPLTQFLLTARFSHVRQVSVNRNGITHGLCDEPLPRSIRKMFDGADHVCDLEIIIIHDTRQMVEA